MGQASRGILRVWREHVCSYAAVAPAPWNSAGLALAPQSRGSLRFSIVGKGFDVAHVNRGHSVRSRGDRVMARLAVGRLSRVDNSIAKYHRRSSKYFVASRSPCLNRATRRRDDYLFAPSAEASSHLACRSKRSRALALSAVEWESPANRESALFWRAA